MDYRRTKYCPELIDVSQKKKEVEKLVEIEHPNAKDMHRYISDNSQKFKLEFIKAYNGKCAYCGASIDLIKKNECKRSNPCTLTFKKPLTTVFLFSDVFWQLW